MGTCISHDSKWKVTACTLLKRTCFISFGCLIKVGCNMVTWHLSTMYIFYCSVTWNSSENNHVYFFFLSMPYTCEPFWEIKEKKEWIWYNRTLDNCKESHHTWLPLLLILDVKPWYTGVITIASSRQTISVKDSESATWCHSKRPSTTPDLNETCIVLTLEQRRVKKSFVPCWRFQDSCPLYLVTL